MVRCSFLILNFWSGLAGMYEVKYMQAYDVAKHCTVFEAISVSEKKQKRKSLLR